MARVRWPLWLRAPARLLLALVILFEEWGWDPLQRLMARIGELPVLRQIESLIARLPPWAALVVFFVPALALLPIKIGALWLLAHGHKLLGLGVIVVAKVAGTAVAARLFTLTHPALMEMPWFARLYTLWAAWKAELLRWVRQSALWQDLQHGRQRLRQLWSRRS